MDLHCIATERTPAPRRLFFYSIGHDTHPEFTESDLLFEFTDFHAEFRVIPDHTELRVAFVIDGDEYEMGPDNRLRPE